MQTSFALDLEQGVFTFDDPRRIAQSLKESAERSTQRKAGPFQSAMSMLNYYINRAGTKLPAQRKEILEKPKTNSANYTERGGDDNLEHRTLNLFFLSPFTFPLL